MIKSLNIHTFSDSFEIHIENLISESERKRNATAQQYQTAEYILLEAIGLNNFEPNTDSVNIKSYKDSFLKTGRLDAEYYQKKYDDYINLICSYPNGCDTIQRSCVQKDSNFKPEDNEEYNYIELSDIGKSGEIKGCTTAQGIELPTRARRKVKTGDVIISSIEGSLDSCAVITEEYNNALCSTGFYIINSKKINSETLLVLFKSEPMQNILKKSCSGTILTAINKTEFQDIPVPFIEDVIQQKIKENVSESFLLQKQSELLLETAKRAVEIAIEENENEALKYIESLEI